MDSKQKQWLAQTSIHCTANPRERSAVLAPGKTVTGFYLWHLLTAQRKACKFKPLEIY